MEAAAATFAVGMNLGGNEVMEEWSVFCRHGEGVVGVVKDETRYCRVEYVENAGGEEVDGTEVNASGFLWGRWGRRAGQWRPSCFCSWNQTGKVRPSHSVGFSRA